MPFQNILIKNVLQKRFGKVFKMFHQNILPKYFNNIVESLQINVFKTSHPKHFEMSFKHLVFIGYFQYLHKLCAGIFLVPFSKFRTQWKGCNPYP